MRFIFIFLLFIFQDTQFSHVYACFPYFQITAQLEKHESPSNQHQTATITPILQWAHSSESLLIGLLISLLAYYKMANNKILLSHEKLGFIQNIVRKTQTPLILIQNLLEEIMADNLPESASIKLKRALGCTNNVIDSYQNIISFDKMIGRMHLESLVAVFELYTYITLISNQCKVYAGTRHIQLKISKDSGYINCRVNEAIMTAALQCLLYKIIDATPPKGCISITLSHAVNYWVLKITNAPEDENIYKKLVLPISALMPVHCCGSIKIIKKVIRMHNGKITGHQIGKAVTFQVTVPMDYSNDREKHPKTEDSAVRHEKTIRENIPHVLLVMTDKELSEYLEDSLSVFFRITILEEPELITSFSIQRNPDAIIIDETVNGIYGDELCARIKSDVGMSNIPVILLINSNDTESYLSHINCAADKLELRMVNVCKLKEDIRRLVNNHNAQREWAKKFLVNNPLAGLPETTAKDDDRALFMDKVHKLLEKNISKEGYTIDMLSADTGMSRTSFYYKIKEITGIPPMDYMHLYKMDKAKILLATQKYTITEVASLLGYCDAKYFGKKFKEFHHVPPTKYAKEFIG